jgi:DNA-nicking Smr family endonuclease
MRRRRDRSLSGEDVALWSHVARTVKPLPGRTMPEAPEPAAPAPEPASPAKAQGPSAARSQPSQKKPPVPALPPLSPFERRTLTSLKRGRQPLEAVLDLHGLRQDEAHGRLRGFLAREQARGARVVLVITGKGGDGASLGEMGGGRGVLRRVVPQWLGMPDLRRIVVGFSDAAQGHGGAGALYVRLRRPKDGAP